jgi:hypothetical protein
VLLSLKGHQPPSFGIIQFHIVAPINYASKVIAPISDSISMISDYSRTGETILR